MVAIEGTLLRSVLLRTCGLVALESTKWQKELLFKGTLVKIFSSLKILLVLEVFVLDHPSLLIFHYLYLVQFHLHFRLHLMKILLIHLQIQNHFQILQLLAFSSLWSSFSSFSFLFLSSFLIFLLFSFFVFT